MAIRINASGEYLRRTASLPSDSAFTMAAWAYLVADRTDNFRYFFGIENNAASSTAYKLIGFSNVNDFQVATSSGNSNFSGTPTNGSWFYLALTCSSTTVNGYYITLTGTVYTASVSSVTAFSEAAMYVGNDSYDEWNDMRWAHVKVWDAALTQAEIQQEMWVARPVRTTNLHLWSPLMEHTDLVDYSGNGKDWTGGGTLSTEDGPPVSWGAPVWVVQFAASSGSQTVNPNLIASESTLYTPTVTAGTVTVAPNLIASAATLYAPTVTTDAATIYPDFVASGSALYAPTVTTGTVTVEPNLVASTATVYSPIVSGDAVTIYPDLIASGAALYAPTVTVGAVTVSPSFVASAATIYTASVLTGVCINGVLTVSSVNGRYFENGDGPLVLGGFHTWYDVQDGGGSDPPSAFGWSEYLTALVAKGCNFTKLWFMETARDWPDFSGQYYTPHPWARTGPGNAADGKLKFDLTTWNTDYFERLRTRSIEAGNLGIYVCIQLFQGWQIDGKGMSTGDPWAYHPFENGNNINSIDGDTDNDGVGEEIRSTSFTAVYNLQKAYVEKVIDTLNDLDHVIFEISNEDGTYSESWQSALVDYIHAYESGKAKQHPVGLTKIWPSGVDSMLEKNNEWLSYESSGADDVADGTYVSVYDTDHTVGLTSEFSWAMEAFANGHGGILYMDEWDGALFGTDRRASATYEKIRRVVGYALDYAARIDLANAAPQAGLSSTNYCIAKTTGTRQFFVYQPNTGSFTLTLTNYSGVFSLEWLKIADGTTQAGSNVDGSAVRTLTPPWSGEVAAFLEQIAAQISPNLIASTETIYSPTITTGAVTVSPNLIASALAIYAPAITTGAVSVLPDLVSSTGAVYEPTVTFSALLLPALIASAEVVYEPAITVGGVSIVPNMVASAEIVHEPTVTRGAVTVLPDLVEGTAIVRDPTVTPGSVAIAPDAISSTGVVYEPTITLTVTPALIASTAAVYEPTVTSGGVQYIAPAVIPSEATIHAPAVSVGAVVIAASAIASTATIYAPTILPGAVALAPDYISGASVVYVPVAASTFTLLPGQVATTAAVYSPAILVGAVAVSPDYIASTATVYQASIASGLAAYPDLISSTAVIFVHTVFTVQVLGATELVAGAPGLSNPIALLNNAALTDGLTCGSADAGMGEMLLQIILSALGVTAGSVALGMPTSFQYGTTPTERVILVEGTVRYTSATGTSRVVSASR